MTPQDILFQASRGLWLVLYLSLPAIVSASLVGLLVSLFQALTQIQEQTLPFAFKLITIVIVMLLTARWLGLKMLTYTDELFAIIRFI